MSEPDLPPPEPDERASPTQISNPRLRWEASRALVWVAVIGTVVLAAYIAEALLVIFGGLVFASMLDGGARLLGRVLPVGRGWRLAIVVLFAVLFLVWLGYFAGSTISKDAAQFPALIGEQIGRLLSWLNDQGLAISPQQIEQIAGQLMSGVGTVTRAIGGILGGLTTLLLIAIIGLYVAMEPRLYERGVGWMLPPEQRADFCVTVSQMGKTMRRLMAGRLAGMVFEGFITWAMLAGYALFNQGEPVPMAVLLGILTGLLAFIPNVGALAAGLLMVLVGFSGGSDMGLYTILVYFVVQTFDGYVLLPLVAKMTVDLAPALVLGFQLVMSVLFGIIGLFLADPLLAMIKVALERRAEQNEHEDLEAAGNPPEPMARKFLYVIAGLVVLVAAALFALRLWSDELSELAFVPSGEFVAQDPLAGNAYRDEAMWFARPGKADNPTRWRPAGFAEPDAAPGFAVFFVHPTSYLERARWNAGLDDRRSQALAETFLRGMASAFAAGEVWAPRYRQAAFGAFLTDAPEAAQALDAAYQDVEQAFDQFLAEVSPDAPIVLAGHSQGAAHVVRLLRERVAGKPLQRRIAMAYPIGWPISVAHDLPALGLPACADAEQAGCIVTWSSFAEPAAPNDWLELYRASPGLDGERRGDSPILCVNPLTGTAGGVAPAFDNLGTLVPNAGLTGGALMPRLVPARCDPRGLLLIGPAPSLGPGLLPGNNYHVYDIPLFWMNLRQDVARRVAAWPR